MAHKYVVKIVPHLNKNKTRSKTKKDYEVWDKARKKPARLVATVTNKDAISDAIAEDRQRLVDEHLRNNPSDRNFVRKHRLSTTIQKGN